MNTAGGPVIGELFSGYGGLGLGVQRALGGQVVWHSENDDEACKILAHHWPHIPNHGDIRHIDWSAVQPVDVLTGGFPCQDVSSAGRRAGMRPGNRSGMWTHMAHAIDQLRPALVVVENVRGLLNAPAHSDVEPCSWCVGEDADRALRALGAVLGDLAVLGYDAEWCGLPASDVGAPHGRFREFLAATPADPGGQAVRLGTRLCAGDPGGVGWGRPDHGGAPHPAADPDGAGLPHRLPGGGPESGGPAGWGTAERCGGATAADPDREGLPGVAQRDGLPGTGRGTAQQRDDADGLGVAARGLPRPPDAAAGDVDWGQYGSAIARWAAIIGRHAPTPTQLGAKGQPRLSPAFVEWMMGLPAGHVTAVPNLGRIAQLKALGNGVVPQQAEMAMRLLVPRLFEQGRAVA